MRKIASLLSMLMLFSALAFGQTTRTVNGQVKDERGDGVTNATITEEGTSNVVKADVNGFFTIKIKTGSSLVITSSGHESKTFLPTAGTGLQAFVVATKSGELAEVVVTTAQGIRKRPKEIGVATTLVKADQITSGRATNLGQALTGKVAGLTIQNTSASVNAAPRITLRGVRSINGDNTALVVLDGVPVPANTINYLNPNDVENIVVLKGGQAATLYGSDGVNGALVITTKKGGGKPQISVTHTSNFENVAYLPEFQTTHGSGSGYGLTMADNFRPFENQQYGDPYDGSIRSVGRRLADGSSLKIPYSFIDGIRKKVWDLGYTNQNDISVSGGDANSSFFISFQDANTKGIVPKDEYRRDVLRFNASKTYGKFRTSFDGTFTMDRAQRTNTNFYFFSLNTPGWVPIDQLKDWKNNPFANPNGYFNDYYNNPYFELDNNRFDGRNNYFNGNLSLKYTPTSWLDFSYRIGTALTTSFSKSWANRFDYSDYAKGNLAVKPVTDDPAYNDYSYVYRARNSPIPGSVADGASFGHRINSDFLITLNKNFNDFTTRLVLGNNVQFRRAKSVSVSSTSVIVPELYNVSNKAGELLGGESNSEQSKIGNYADLTVGYKDFIFLHGSFRIDQSSVYYKVGRKQDLYTYPYYGGDISVVLTDAFPSIKSDVLSYLKLRGGWNKNGNDPIGPYSLDATYSNGGGFPYGSLVGVTVDNTIPSEVLGPEFLNTTELGFEASFWKNRVSIDASVYKQVGTNQVLNVAISSATGATGTLLNAAKVENKGADVEVKAQVFRKKNWSVDVFSNLTYNTNVVKELFGGLQRVQLNSTGANNFIFAEIGQPFPLLKTTYFAVDPATGKTIVDPTDGWPTLANDLKTQGVTIPKYQWGSGVKVNYKNWSLNVNAEYRSGNMTYNDMGEDMAFTGSGAATTKYNRQQFIFPNSVYWDGSKYVDNTTIPVENYIAIYEGWGDYSFTRGVLGNGDFFTTRGDFWKIREMLLAYEFPNSILKHTKVIKGANLSVFARNPFTWLSKDNIYTDPEFSNTNGNGVGINTTGNTPPVRQFGATLNLRF